MKAAGILQLVMSAADPLAPYRDRFHIPKTSTGSDCVYLCGHSLGLQPQSARAYVEQEFHDWERFGVEGHFHARNPWMPYHEILTEPTARLVGALPSEVVVMNSLTVNLHLMMVSFYRATPARHKIIIESKRFSFRPIRRAIADRLSRTTTRRTHCSKLRRAPARPRSAPKISNKLLAEKGEQVALILLGGVNYYTGQAFDCSRITQAGHAQGCVVGFRHGPRRRKYATQTARLGCGFCRVVQLQISQRRSWLRRRVLRPRTACAESGVAAICRMVGPR